ncbi:MAG TPA: hypothetical protein VH082_02445 [Rudaea sp.]|jgi:hypothetical protein|nr:hypothetical protein [Rudaea sp.]
MKTIVAVFAIGFVGSALAAERVQVIPPDHLANYWLLQSSSASAANVPNSGVNLDAPSCAVVSYVVEKDGSTSHVALERVVPQGDLGKVAVSVVSGMHFAAAPSNLGKDAVYTYVVMPFNLPGAQSTNAEDKAVRARVTDACKIDGFMQRRAP